MQTIFIYPLLRNGYYYMHRKTYNEWMYGENRHGIDSPALADAFNETIIMHNVQVTRLRDNNYLLTVK